MGGGVAGKEPAVAPGGRGFAAAAEKLPREAAAEKPVRAATPEVLSPAIATEKPKAAPKGFSPAIADEKPARPAALNEHARADRTRLQHALRLVPLAVLAAALAGCSPDGAPAGDTDPEPAPETAATVEEQPAEPEPEELRTALDIAEDYRPAFDHGEKGSEFQKYIVLHDTEVDASPEAIVSSWDGAGKGVAAHFVVGRDGHIVQCVPLDRIAHHVGNGDTGHNEEYGVEDESRDDQVGRSAPPTSHTTDYGMNSYSVGIELVHVGGEGAYPTAQLDALDGLIAYIDAYYGCESAIIDHKAWRTGNSDTSPEFAEHLASYQERRVHANG